MNKIVEGRNEPQPKRDLNEERMDCYQFGTVPAPKPPCDHYAVRYMGYIRCRDCHAVWNLGLKGPIWVEHDA